MSLLFIVVLFYFSLCFISFYLFFFFFFFKQKTAYEMRISDWSSDVCSSDLWARATVSPGWICGVARMNGWVASAAEAPAPLPPDGAGRDEIGRASCRERVCQYV